MTEINDQSIPALEWSVKFWEVQIKSLEEEQSEVFGIQGEIIKGQIESLVLAINGKIEELKK